jgi:hypothetical protein
VSPTRVEEKEHYERDLVVTREIALKVKSRKERIPIADCVKLYTSCLYSADKSSTAMTGV